MAFHLPEKFRRPEVELRLYGEHGNATNGVCQMASEGGWVLTCIASDGAGWEHVSVSARRRHKLRAPTWAEMCMVKDMFWDAEDAVVQFHPPRSEYVNFAEALHLWRPCDGWTQRPPSVLVGPR